MSSYANSAPVRPGDVLGTMRLLAYLALAIVLMVLDHRGGWLSQWRAQAQIAAQPVWWLAGLPSRIGAGVREDAVLRTQLAHDNRVLRNALLISGARQARLQAEAAETQRLRAMLGAAQRYQLDVQLAPILDIDLDPTRQRLVLDVGSSSGTHIGQSVIDAGGLLGQVIAVTPGTSTVLLLTDPAHAVPVAVARSGVRLVAYGRGNRIELVNIPLTADVKIGDTVITSGLGGRFPPGFPVGTITSLAPDDSRAFLVAQMQSAAQLDRGRDVLLLKSEHRGIEQASVTASPAATHVDAATSTSARTPAPAANAAARPSASVPTTTSTAPASTQEVRP